MVSVWGPKRRWEDWALLFPVEPTPFFKSEAYWGKATMYLFGLLFLAQETTRNFLSVLKSLLWCRKRKRLWDLFGPKGLWCPLLLQLRAWVRLLVTLWYVSCLALIQSGTKDLVLQAITYGTDYFLSYKGIFITSKRGNETRGAKTL